MTSKLVDEVLRFSALGVMVGTMLIAPNAVQALDKPIKLLCKSLSERERAREAMRVVRYMKQKGYLVGSYEHGLQLTEKAQKRLKRIELDDIIITARQHWDKRWRIILYDIPEQKRKARRVISCELRRIGCFQLQESAWISPFPCRQEVSTIAAHVEVSQYLSYFEAINLDNEPAMLRRFKEKYKTTRF